MTRYKSGFRKSLSLLLVLIMLLSVMPTAVFAADGSDPAYLVFTSDTHNVPAGQTYGNGSSSRMGTWLQTVAAELGNIQFDTMGFCGDMGSAINGGQNYWKAVKEVMDVADNSPVVKDTVYTYGNHDVFAPGSDHTPKAEYQYCTAKMQQIGVAKDTDDYTVYCFGAGSSYQVFLDSDIAKLADFMKTADPDKPVFILSHYPLHTFTATNGYGNRTITNSGKVIDVLNDYPNAVFLWGHNHTLEDTHYSSVYTGDLDGTPINFTYASAGAMVDSEYNEKMGVSILGKGLTARVNDDETVTYAYYNVNGKSLGEVTVDYSGTKATVKLETEAYFSAQNFEDGKDYVLTIGGYGLSNVKNGGFTVEYFDGIYRYDGFDRVALSVSNGAISKSAVNDDLIWTAEKVDGGFALKTKDGKYLNAAYKQKAAPSSDTAAAATLDDPCGGNLYLGDAPQAWVVSEGMLKNVALSQTTGKDRFLNSIDANSPQMVDKGPVLEGVPELITIRSSGEGCTLGIYTLGKVSGLSYCKESNFADGQEYLITVDGYGLTDKTDSGFTILYYDGYYRYDGMQYAPVTAAGNFVTSDVTNDMLWIAEAVPGGFALKDKVSGLYLNASYKALTQDAAGTEDDPCGGNIYLGTQKQAWSYVNGKLMHNDLSKTSTKQRYLVRLDDNSEQTSAARGPVVDGQPHVITIRSDGQGTAVNLYRYGSTSGASSFYSAENFTNGRKYVIAINDLTLTNERHEGFTQEWSGYYSYKGLQYAPFSVSGNAVSSEIKDNMVWTAVAVDGGFALKDNNGKYLCAEYKNSSAGTLADPKGGNLYIGDEPQAWIVSSTGKLKHVALSESTGSGKYVVYQGWGSDTVKYGVSSYFDGEPELITIRSDAAGNGLALYELYEPEAPLFSKVSSLTEGIYVITNGNIALTDAIHNGYLNYDRDTNRYYDYKGLNAETIGISGNAINNELDPSMYWIVHKSGNGFTIQNTHGEYLCGEYYSSAPATQSNPLGGRLYLSPYAQVWTYDGGLKNATSGKYISYVTKQNDVLVSGSVPLFTVRTNQMALNLYKARDGFEIPENTDSFLKSSRLYDGMQYVITSGGFIMTRTVDNGYVLKDNNGLTYSYVGFEGTPYSALNGALNSDVSHEMVWYAEEMEGGFALKTVFGEYLNASYITGNPYCYGSLTLGGEPEAWQLVNGKLFHVKSGKYLSYDATHSSSGYLIDGEVGLFTLRTNGSLVDAYQAGENSVVAMPKSFAVKATAPFADGRYVMVANGKVMTTSVHPGFTWSGSNDVYTGFCGVKANIGADGVITDGIDDSMIWVLDNDGNNVYTFQDQNGQYLSRKYGNQFCYLYTLPVPTNDGLDCSTWIYDTNSKSILSTKIDDLKNNKRRKIIDNTAYNGNAVAGSGNSIDLFTIRTNTSGTDAESAFTFYKVYDTAVVTYTTDGNGSVSLAKDVFYADKTELTGSTATPNPGYVFLRWEDEEGNEVCTDATFVPAEPAYVTYTAIFGEAPAVTISYVAGENGTVTESSEDVMPISGTPYGSTAIGDKGYHLLNWTDEDGNVVSTDIVFIPQKINGAYEAHTYTANFQKDPACIGDKPVTIHDGTFKLYFNSSFAGEYTLKQVGDLWTIYDNDSAKYVGFANGMLKYSSTIYLWHYDGGFYTYPTFASAGKIFSFLLSVNKYYIGCSGSSLYLTHNPTSAVIYEHFSVQEHTVKFIDNGDGTHSGFCSVCGRRVVEAHVFEHHVCTCGATDQEFTGVTKVTVNTSVKVEKVKFLLIFNRTVKTNVADIICVARGTDVAKVEYRTGSRWIEGTTVSSTKSLGSFDIRVTDSNGKVSYWFFDGTDTFQTY